MVSSSLSFSFHPPSREASRRTKNTHTHTHTHSRVIKTVFLSPGAFIRAVDSGRASLARWADASTRRARVIDARPSFHRRDYINQKRTPLYSAPIFFFFSSFFLSFLFFSFFLFFFFFSPSSSVRLCMALSNPWMTDEKVLNTGATMRERHRLSSKGEERERTSVRPVFPSSFLPCFSVPSAIMRLTSPVACPRYVLFASACYACP